MRSLQFIEFLSSRIVGRSPLWFFIVRYLFFRTRLWVWYPLLSASTLSFLSSSWGPEADDATPRRAGKSLIRAVILFIITLFTRSKRTETNNKIQQAPACPPPDHHYQTWWVVTKALLSLSASGWLWMLMVYQNGFLGVWRTIVKLWAL